MVNVQSEDTTHAYEVLAQHYGFSAAYIKSVLEAHFETPSEAGWEHMQYGTEVREYTSTDSLNAWCLDELRHFIASLNDLRAKGMLPPLVRHIDIDCVKRDKHGKYYVASHEQLQQELELQHRMGIDPDGNLVFDGQIVKHRWLQSQE